MAMWIDKIFGGNKLQNAGTAKERLQFIIARERSGAASFDMQKMQQEVIDVIKNIGSAVKAIDLTEAEDAIEVWVMYENEPTCLYLFPYDMGIVQVGE